MARIIHVCGTMGSGKTTLIRTWMAGLPFTEVANGRPRPVAYVCVERQLWVVGPYSADLQTSGCDACKNTPENYAEVLHRFEQGHTVVYEGLFMMNHTRGLALLRAARGAVTVLRLTTPLEDCRAGVLARRAAQGNTDPLPPRFEDGLRGNDVRARNYAHKMKGAGATVLRVSREEALPKLRELTGG